MHVNTKLGKDYVPILIQTLVTLALIAIFVFAGVLDFLFHVLGQFLTLSLLIVVHAIVTFFIIKSTFLKPLTKFSQQIDHNKNDLTLRFSNARSGSINEVTRYLNVFIANIHELVFTLKNISEEEKRLGDILQTGTIQSVGDVNEIVSSSTSIRTNINNFEKRIASISSSIRQINSAIVEVASRARQQSGTLKDASDNIMSQVNAIKELDQITQEKLKLVSDLKDLSQQSSMSMGETSISIKEIAKSAQAIREFMDVIGRVASQTNLLAMNASIEAAHAGESGRGFTVVALEIGKLAESTLESTQGIVENIDDITNRIQTAVKLTNSSEKNVSNLSEGMLEMITALEQVGQSLAVMDNSSHDIHDYLSRSIGLSEEVEASMSEIQRRSTLIEKNMNEGEKLSYLNKTSIEDLLSNVEHVRTNLEQLSVIGNRNSDVIGILDRGVRDFKIVDPSSLRSKDGQSLIDWRKEEREIPPRPADPDVLLDSDSGRWHDVEFVGTDVSKLKQPMSKADGPRGKRVAVLLPHDHSYFTAFSLGAQKMAKAYGVELDIKIGDASHQTQLKQLYEIARNPPDALVIAAADASKSIDLFKFANGLEIPTFAANTLPPNEAFKYITSWTGPNDWSQFRQLSRAFAELMRFRGDYVILRHFPGNSCFVSRTWSVVTELKKIGPSMRCLEMESAMTEDAAYRLIHAWVKKHGDGIKGIITGDPGACVTGVARALKELNRKDIVWAGSGNSQLTQDLVKEGLLKVINYQSAEGDGALAVEAAIQFFDGLPPKDFRFLTTEMITEKNVEGFYPVQW